jgi:hypothetical protein
LEKAIDELAPYFYGNLDVKRLLLYACCSYDPEDPKSVIPFMLYGESGGGKSYLAEGLDSSLGAYIFKSESLRKTVGGMYDKEEKKVVRMPDRQFIVFDELDKWSPLDMNLTLPLVGEKAFAVEYGRAIERFVRAIPLFMALPNWEEAILAGKRSSPYKLQVFRQIQRRSVHLRLEEVKESEILKKISQDSTEKRTPCFDNLRSVIGRAKQSDLDPAGDFSDWIAGFVSKFEIEGTAYRPELCRLIVKLGFGCAKAKGKSNLQLGDFKEVGSVLLEHSGLCGVRNLGEINERIEERNRQSNFFGGDYK